MNPDACPHNRLRVLPPRQLQCTTCGLVMRDYDTAGDAIAAMRRMLGTEHKIKPDIVGDYTLSTSDEEDDT